MKPRQIATSTTASAIAIALIAMALHGDALWGGWQYDDGAHLYFVAQHSPLQYFTDPTVMYAQSCANITPWNPLFYHLGMGLFGLNAAGHYAHLVLTIALTAFATYVFLKRYVDPGTALVGATLYLAAPPTAAISHMLMTGHYAYGLLFSVACVHLYAGAIERDSVPRGIAAAGCYGLACLCKELYVPLALVLVAWPGPTLRARARVASPVIVVSLGYVALRLLVMGGFGGPASVMHYGLFPQDASGLPHLRVLARISVGALLGLEAHLFGVGITGWTALAVALAIVVRGRARRCSAWFLVAVLAVLGLPLLPQHQGLVIVDKSQSRVLYLACWALSAALAWKLHGRPRSAAIGVALAALWAIGQRATVEGVDGPQRAMAAQNRFLVETPGGGYLLPHEPHAFKDLGYLDSMARAVHYWSGRPRTTILMDEEELVALGEERGREVWTLVPDRMELRQLGAGYAARVADFQDRVARGAGRRLDVELRLEVRPKYKVVRWRLTGDPGRTTMIVREVCALEVPAEGEHPFEPEAVVLVPHGLHIRFVRVLPDGAMIRSPVLELAVTHTHTVRWSSTDR